MIQPNTAALNFTFWMLNISKQRLSGPQRLITEEVYNAALGVYPISEQTWYNFNLFAAWRNQYYIIYRDYGYAVYPDLLTDLVYAWNFEANANSNFGVNNGTSTGVTFNSSYGKINNGAGFTTPTSRITISPVSLSGNYSYSIWVRPDLIHALYNFIWSNSALNSGLLINGSTNKVSFWKGTFYDSAYTPIIGGWFMATVTFDGANVKLYVNGNLERTLPITTGFGSLGIFSYDNVAYSLEGAMDSANYWSRALTDSEVLQLWNGGAGIQYPF